MPQIMDQRNRLALGLRACRREMAAQSPLVFAEVYLADNCHAEFSRMHIEVFEVLQQMTRQRKARVAIAAPRGHAKSTIVSLAYVLWCVLYEKERLLLIAHKTIRIKSLGHLEACHFNLLGSRREDSAIVFKRYLVPSRISRIRTIHGRIRDQYIIDQDAVTENNFP